jgi:hypothetical protein
LVAAFFQCSRETSGAFGSLLDLDGSLDKGDCCSAEADDTDGFTEARNFCCLNDRPVEADVPRGDLTAKALSSGAWRRKTSVEDVTSLVDLSTLRAREVMRPGSSRICTSTLWGAGDEKAASFWLPWENPSFVVDRRRRKPQFFAGRPPSRRRTT